MGRVEKPSSIRPPTINPKEITFMKILREFRRFILIKSAEGHHSEIRAYVFDNLNKLSLGFEVPPQVIVDAVEAIGDDRALATRLLETTIRAEDFLRKTRQERRARAAQQSANVLAAVTQWKGGRAHLDMMSLLSSALTRRNDFLIFVGDQFTVSIPMAPLLDLAKISRVRADLSGFVDAHGLHLRWRTGGLHLRSQTAPRAAGIMVHLPSAPASVVAA
jgi:hypothetical protein